MKTIHILGHDNVALGVMLDIIYLKYAKEYAIKIYNNISPEENQCFHLPFMHLELDVTVIQTNKKQGNIVSGTNDLIMLSGTSPKSKVLIFKDFQDKYGIHASDISSLIHPSAIIGHGCKIGNGTLIGPGSIIAPYTTLENFVTVNRNVSIGHHDHIGSFSSINPGCNIGGVTKIGRSVTIGLGTSVFDNISIGDYSVIGGGSTINKDIPEYTLAYGAPAKAIKKLG